MKATVINKKPQLKTSIILMEIHNKLFMAKDMIEMQEVHLQLTQMVEQQIVELEQQMELLPIIKLIYSI